MSKKRILFLVSLLCALFLLYNEQRVQEVLETRNSAVAEAEVTSTDTYLVSRVVDGDTIEVTKDGAKEKVRLLGINTPETVDPRKKVECFGKEASAELKQLLTGKQVKLVTDDTQTKYDKYGRLLAYVYTEDGLFVNKHMIEEGYAYEYTYTAPYIFQYEFKEAQKLAETEGKGLWGVGVCE